MELSLVIVGIFVIVILVVLLIRLLFGPSDPNTWDI